MDLLNYVFYLTLRHDLTMKEIAPSDSLDAFNHKINNFFIEKELGGLVQVGTSFIAKNKEINRLSWLKSNYSAIH